jgi:hypothetical protein
MGDQGSCPTEVLPRLPSGPREAYGFRYVASQSHWW